jgi:amidase
MVDDQGVGTVGFTATDIARMVRAGTVRPVDVVRAHLGQIETVDRTIGAFQVVRAERAVAEAEAVGARPDLASLPLAGVPIAVKDNIPVGGDPMRVGSAATPEAPRGEDHEVVRRLREAGAVVIGITRLPEFALWGTTDGSFGTVRNPWNLGRSPGGSSGGSAAAVATAMAAVGHGNDMLGSIRIPAACCGVLGIKPGRGVVPSDVGIDSWYGLGENGPLATTVDDAALVLAVMAGRSELREVGPDDRPLRVAVSVRSPLFGSGVDPELKEAVRETGTLLAGAGHDVREVHPPYPTRTANAVAARWFGSVAREVEGLDPARLERRTRGHAAAGRLVLRLGWVKDSQRVYWRRRISLFFAGLDLLITPTLAQPTLPVDDWSHRGWMANLLANARYAPFTMPWNFAGFPAASVPAGVHSSGTPIGVQLVAPEGGEGVLLRVAKQLESLRPWPRHAQPAGV